MKEGKKEERKEGRKEGKKDRPAAINFLLSVFRFAYRGRGHGQQQRIPNGSGEFAANRTVSGALGHGVVPVDFGLGFGAVENIGHGDKALVRLHRGHDVGVFGTNRSRRIPITGGGDEGRVYAAVVSN